MKTINYLMALLVFILMSCTQSQNQRKNEDKALLAPKLHKDENILLIGTYTNTPLDMGIYLYNFDYETAKFDSISAIASPNASYLVVSGDRNFVYAVEENGNNSAVHAFAIDKNKEKLTLLNSRATEGADPCYIETDKNGNHIFTANYSGGSISIFHLEKDGQLAELENVIKFEGEGADKKRQSKPHLHSIRYSPDAKYLFATDLGTDKIYRFDANEAVFKGQPAISTSTMKTFPTPSGTGPRHFDFHPSHKFFYLLGELSGNIIVYEYNNGDLQEKQQIEADSLNAQGSADIHVSPDGKFLYASTRLKGDGIVVFAIDQKEGTLTRIGYQATGGHPRNFIIAPNGKYLLVASRDENKVQIFSIDPETGLLSDTYKAINIYKPVCLKFI